MDYNPVILVLVLAQTACGLVLPMQKGNEMPLLQREHYNMVNEAYTEKFLDMDLDHFNYEQPTTFKLRYLVSDKYWTKGVGPILFYTGNEGDITSFWDNTGFVFELAQKMNGLIVFAEHRYYGKSLPFGDESFHPNNIGYLSIEQALADFAILITKLKSDYQAEMCHVLAFGGSYGGMLSGYMRYKYPHLVTAAVASSAPFVTIAGGRKRSEFFQTVTQTFSKADARCPGLVQEAFGQMDKLFNNGVIGRRMLEGLFKFCPDQMTNPTIEKHAIGWARNAFTLLAMMDYPYPTNFMVPLPGNPVNLACTMMSEAGTAIEGLANVTNLLYGSSEKCHNTYNEYVECSDPTGCGTGPANPPWDYQACTEMVLPGGSNNVTDMFPPLQFTLPMRNHYCARRFGLSSSRQDWLATQFWGSLGDISHASRIIFPNGDLDPWYPGGVLENLSEDLIAVRVEGGAHHLDLRASNPADPASVVKARETIFEHLTTWMAHSEWDRIKLKWHKTA